MEKSAVIVQAGCGACGYLGAWPDGSTHCPACGKERVAEETKPLNISVSFAAPVCDECEVVVPEGLCPSCGQEVVSAAASDATRARMSALAPLRDRARVLRDSFAEFPTPHIPVTTQQTITVVVDADLPGRALKLLGFAHEIGGLDLETPSEIGSTTRRRVVEILDEVERVRTEARRLAAFRPPVEIAELPAAIAGLAATGAHAIAAVLEVAAAGTLVKAQEAAAELQGALKAPPESGLISALLKRAPTILAAEDLDARASLALGIDGQYSDELGMIDPAKVFAVAADQPSAMTALARGAGGYLAHLLDTPPNELPDGAAVLAACAVPLAVLDRPFGPHRTAELARHLLREAAARAPDELNAALSLYDEHQGRAFAAATRATRAMRRIALGQTDDPVDLIESVLSIYRRLAEGPYRESLRLLIAARAAADGRAAPAESLLLGDIDGYLAGWHDELGDSLRNAAERDLRNAESHEDFHVDPASLDVVTPGRRVSPDVLDEAFTGLAATLAAIEAAILCYRLDSRQTYQPPEWLIRGDHPDALALMLQPVAGASGLEISSVSRDSDELTLTLEGPKATDVERARLVLVGAVHLTPTVRVLRAATAEGLVTAIAAEAVQAWQQAEPDEQDLALIELLYDSNVRTGTPQADAIGDAVCAALRVVLNVDISAVLAAPTAHTPLERLARRLRRIARFATAHRAALVAEDRPILENLRAAYVASAAAVLEPDRLAEVAEPLELLEGWATRRGPLPVEYGGPGATARASTRSGVDIA